MILNLLKIYCNLYTIAQKESVNTLPVLFDLPFNCALLQMQLIIYYVNTCRYLARDCYGLKSDSIDSIKALSKFREDGFFGNDVVILLDEMHLQQQVQFDGQTIIGCNEDLQMFKSILCFMAMSLTNTIPFIIKAIPISKLS